MAIVDFLQCGSRGCGRGTLGTLESETVAQNQLFIFLLHMENLENACTGFLHDFMAISTRTGILWYCTGFGSLDMGQARFQTIQEGFATSYQLGIGGVLTVLQESVLFKGELMEVLAKLQMALKRVGRTHVCGVATGVVAITGPLGEPEV